MTAILDDAEDLYRGVVTDPDRWNEQAIADWVDGVSMHSTLDRATAKHLRRIVTMAGKLQQFWEADPRRDDASIEWRSRVDIALGPRAWRPILDLGMHQLEVEPDEDLFERVAGLFKVVNRVEWLDGATFEEWSGGTGRN